MDSNFFKSVIMVVVVIFLFMVLPFWAMARGEKRLKRGDETPDGDSSGERLENQGKERRERTITPRK